MCELGELSWRANFWLAGANQPSERKVGTRLGGTGMGGGRAAGRPGCQVATS